MHVEVSDTGIGMRAEDIPRALEPFQQIDGAVSRKHEGTGLGLPLCKRLIELHGGALLLDSAPSVGTQATIVFPADRAPRWSSSAARLLKRRLHPELIARPAADADKARPASTAFGVVRFLNENGGEMLDQPVEGGAGRGRGASIGLASALARRPHRRTNRRRATTAERSAPTLDWPGSAPSSSRTKP